MPLKNGPNCLGEPRDIALRRLNALWTRLIKDSQYLKLYTDFIHEYEQLGHMKEIVTENDNSDITHYMPHHGVLRPEKSTTKLRVVFNATNPTSNGLSLNSIQYNGGLAQNDLFTIMIKFKEHPYAFTADVKMMYRMILIHESQQPLLRILWKESPEDPVKTFEMKTVTYGTESAPFLTTRTLLQLSRDEEKNFPLAAPVLKENFNMDDVLCGAASLIEAKPLKNQLSNILQKGGMQLHKWGSRHLELASNIIETMSSRIQLKPRPARVELHGFADASEKCYGAVIYCRSQSPDDATKVKIVTSKSRVEEKKSVTMLRLELCVAVFLAKLMKRVDTASQMKTPPVYLWSDSTIVLAWIQKEPNVLKTFLANRVATIQHLTNAEQWHHVSSGQNPADLVSRGLDPSSLHNNSLWWSDERRGRPSLIFSENGKTFIGANAELKRSHKLVINPDAELAGFLVDENINWKFLHPRAPNFGGLWEAGFKSFKFHFKRNAGNSRFTYEEFLTIMTQIEGILNSCPLTPLSTNIDGETFLGLDSERENCHILRNSEKANGSTPSSSPESSPCCYSQSYDFFPALADGITRRALFNVWNEKQDPKRKIDAVLSLVRSTTDFDKHENQQQLKFRKIVKNFCSFVGKKWMSYLRNEKFFFKSNDVWLSGRLERARPLLASASKQELAFTTRLSMQVAGERDAALIVKQVTTCSPRRATRPKKS
ncbi:integrase catalytic domain-containing protein [Trichonephila clavipes]|nr:integrase catalytic domain-containing protein [Trichonephila clavipes]